MNSARKRVAKVAARLNRAAGRVSGFKLARAPLHGTLNHELHHLLNTLQIAHVIDVGAHKGGFAENLRSGLGFDGRISSFEPSPHAFDLLAKRASTDPLWKVHNLAAGSVDGEAVFTEFESDELNSLRSLGEFAQEYAPLLQPKGQRVVSVVRLDSVWQELVSTPARNVLLKTDTQGFDLEVIRGAGALITGIAAVVMEVAVRPLYENAPVIHEIFAELNERGFEPTGAFPIHRYDHDLRVIEFDCTFVNRAVVASLSPQGSNPIPTLSTA